MKIRDGKACLTTYVNSNDGILIGIDDDVTEAWAASAYFELTIRQARRLALALNAAADKMEVMK